MSPKGQSLDESCGLVHLDIVWLVLCRQKTHICLYTRDVNDIPMMRSRQMYIRLPVRWNPFKNWIWHMRSHAGSSWKSIFIFLPSHQIHQFTLYQVELGQIPV